MELVDMPGRSPILRICKLGSFKPKKIWGTLKGPFCVSEVGVPNIYFGELFYMRGGPLRIKNDLMAGTEGVLQEDWDGTAAGFVRVGAAKAG